MLCVVIKSGNCCDSLNNVSLANRSTIISPAFLLYSVVYYYEIPKLSGSSI